MFAHQPCVENAPCSILGAEKMALSLYTYNPVTIVPTPQALN